MNTPDTLKACLDIYIASLPMPGRELRSADVEQGQRCKQMLMEGGAASVPLLLDRLGDPDFLIKDLSYDLILDIGETAKAALYEARGHRGPIVDLWIARMLKHLGDEEAMGALRPLLKHPDADVRHLSALALAFDALDAAKTVTTEIYAVLAEALNNEHQIEGTPFNIAGSALGCLTHLSGIHFLDSPRAIRFYNYEHFLYPPPVHPFPFAMDFYSPATEEEKQRIRQRVDTWLANIS